MFIAAWPGKAASSSAWLKLNAALAFCTILAIWPVDSDKPSTSPRKVWIEVYDMWQAPFSKANSAVSRGPTSPASRTSSGNGAATTSPVIRERYSRARCSVTSNNFSTSSTCWSVRNSSSGCHWAPASGHS